MKFLTGVDLRPHSDGALRYAAWLCAQIRAHGQEPQLLGRHVVESAKLRSLADPDQIAEVELAAKAALELAASDSGARAQHARLELRFDEVAEVSLNDLCAEHPDATALVIGRRARVAEEPIVRLGGTARRLTRNLPVPVIVTAPDLDPAMLGKGPIILATDLDQDAEGAVAWARSLASAMHRELVLVHVVSMPDAWESYYSESVALDMAARSLQAESERELERWAGQHAFQGHKAVVRQGPVVGTLRVLAVELESPLVVLGSRRLSLLARIFNTSVGTELAAVSDIPVALVPPAHSE